jgi:hypothetical protein
LLRITDYTGSYPKILRKGFAAVALLYLFLTVSIVVTLSQN